MTETKPPSTWRFPSDFLWGAATSAYQVEGGNVGSDLWEWEKRRGWERSGRAANSYELWEEDVRLLGELGLNAYRFSVEWGRLFPSPGRHDPAVLDHYRRLAGRLLERGLTPLVTLHHFTHPRWLLEARPLLWADPGTIDPYLEFVDLVSGALPVRHWIPFNEPNVVLGQGFLTGYFPPGRRWALKPARAFLGGPLRNMAEAHRLAYALLKRKDPRAQVGVAQNIACVQPLRPGRDERAASAWDEFFHWSFLDAAALGRFDADLDGTKETVLGEGGALDFIGVNYYTRVFVREFPFGLAPLRALPLYSEWALSRVTRPFYVALGGLKGSLDRDEMGHEIYPEGLASVLRHAHRRYGLPLMITENGAADASGALRELYLLSHLAHLHAALEEGLPVKGYFHWSLIDNYEWGSYAPRFGLYRVRFDDGCRREATSAARLYADLVRSQRSR